MTERFAVILAAGQGTRMKSNLYKVLHPVCGKPMVQHVVDHVREVNIDTIVTVIGHGAEKVKAQLDEQSKYVLQEKQLGTAHAVMQAAELLSNKEGITLVICGDTPLISSDTMKSLMEHHQSSEAKATILTAETNNPSGYGRIIRNKEGLVEKIVEHKDANEDELKINEINTGTYCFDNQMLFSSLKKVGNENSQGEYYLPDVIEILKKQGEIISAYCTAEFEETLGVNDRVALSQAEKIMQRKINEQHMKNGVSFIDADHTYISADATIGRDTVIYPGTIIKGRTIIGEECAIGPHSELVNCAIGDNTEVRQSVIHDSQVGNAVKIGPFAHIRPSSVIEDEVKIGNFVEVKKSTFGSRSKASHLSYIGDAQVGEDVNLGCGSITVNYDGTSKHLTKIEDGAFIGCNANLIAPVTVGKDAYVAAGSTITDDVPSRSLSIARARQTNKEDYAKRLKKN